MKDWVEFAAVASVGILPYLVGTVLLIRRPTYHLIFSPAEQLARLWIGAVSVIAVTLFVAVNQPDGLASLGLYPGRGVFNFGAAWTGMLGLAVLSIVIFMGHKLLRRSRPEPDLSRPPAADILRYRNGWERVAYLTTLPLLVAAEEVVCRGYLVLLWGSRVGTYVPWFILSVTLSVVMHLYQGRDLSTIVFHLMSAAFCVGLVVFTRNLMSAIGPHLFWNICCVHEVWKRGKQEGGQLPGELSNRSKLVYLSFITVNTLLLGAGLLLLS